MNRLRISLFALLLVLILSPRVAWSLEDAILALVNDEVITLRDLREYINATYMSLVAQGMNESKITAVMKDMEKNGLNKLIEDKLILSRANEMGMTVRDKPIDDEIADIKAKYPSEEIFMDALVKHGSTLSDMRKKIEDQLKIKYVIEHEIRSKIYISPQEITKYYNKHLDDFQTKEKINLDSIFVSFGSNKIAAKEKAQQALDKIKQGEDFQKVAKEYSDSPSFGSVERGQLLPEIEKIVFHLPQDIPSELVELETGYYIFKMTGRTSASVASLKDAKDEIHEKLYRTRFREMYLKWINKLKEDAFIEIKQ